MQVEFDNVILKIATPLQRALGFIPQEIKLRCEEIRLRANLPVCLTVSGGVVFVCKNSQVSNKLPKNPLIATKEDLNATLSLLCNRSVYLHENEIKQGFVSFQDGCRAGVCGIFNNDNMLVDVGSINIRIAKQVFNCAQYLLPHTTEGMLIAGPPGSGKTTLLRDLVRLLSNGELDKYYRVAVIDTRGEISGRGSLDLGINTDVLYTTQKPRGIDIAIRTMFPHFVAFDEIGTIQELNGIIGCFNAGIGVITTAHCNDEYDILNRDITQKIISLKAVKKVAILSKNIGEKAKIFTLEELTKNAVY